MDLKKSDIIYPMDNKALDPGNMQVIVIFFGQLSEITGTGSLLLDNVYDTDQLENTLKKMHPALHTTKHVIAVDKQMITENTPLKNNCTIAFLPPFSGG